MEHTDKKSTALKLAGVIGIVVPLLGAVVTASFQYRQFVLENRDNNFRQVASKVASVKPEERHSSATNLGNYLEDPIYAKRSLDILISMAAVELDGNVLNAVVGNFRKLKKTEDRIEVIHRLLLRENSFSASRGAMGEWSEKTTRDLEESYNKFLDELKSLSIQHNVSIDKLPINLIADIHNLAEKSKMQNQASRQYSEIATHEEIIAGFISSLLSDTVNNPLKGIKFFQNAINYHAIVNAKLIDPRIINSAITSSTLANFEAVGEVSGCTIRNTTFQYSIISESTFRNCEIKQTLFSGTNGFYASLVNTSFIDSSFDDVFFYRSDLSGADFRGVQSLKAEYFYGSINYELANFDESSLIGKINLINKAPDKFLTFLHNSTLTKSRYESICKNISETENITCMPKL